jgi:hypothetical protein
MKKVGVGLLFMMLGDLDGHRSEQIYGFAVLMRFLLEWLLFCMEVAGLVFY